MNIPTEAKMAIMPPEKLKQYIPALTMAQLKMVYEIILMNRFHDIHTVPKSFVSHIICRARVNAPLIDAEIQKRAEIEFTNTSN